MSTPTQARTSARRSAVQALYQWQLTGADLSEIERQFIEEHGLGNADVAYFNELLHQIPQKLDEIDAALAQFVDRSIASIDPVERAILRIGAYELLFHPELPYRVVLNEGINLAKGFGAAQSHKYVNGILDKIAHAKRTVEIQAGRAKG
ncbi:transcription antitermination factor NusB [Methylococcus sp. EFPC2]|uniref:transcription antitermination factor NusB n=1 Tax=Methylococcus sp. EFPC2 TaxID=2812648 RepID=UPI001967FBF7|nr:transcription antitermination factor NusB [Methylococcus sp. EFPC2]QSA97679.1 transcription antitermination factor NusB [Methylococcus sp. EFPC2]